MQIAKQWDLAGHLFQATSFSALGRQTAGKQGPSQTFQMNLKEPVSGSCSNLSGLMLSLSHNALTTAPALAFKT